MKKFLWRTIPSVLSLILIYYAWTFAETNISRFLKRQTIDYLKEQFNWELEAKNLRLRLLPPSAIITDLKLSPPPDIKKAMPFISLKEADVRLDFLSLLGGRIEISRVRTQGLNFALNTDELKKSDEEFKEIPTEPIFHFLQQMPIRNLIIEESNFGFTHKSETYQLNNINCILQFNGQIISTFISAAAVIQNQLIYSPPIQVRWRSQLSKRDLHLDEFSLKSTQAQINLTAALPQLKTFLQKPEGDILFQLNGTLNDWNPLLQTYFNLPLLEGKIQLQGRGKWDPTKRWLPTTSIDLEMKELNVANYFVGNISVKGDLKDSHFKAQQLSLEHPAGQLQLKGIHFETAGDFPLSAQLNLNHLDLQKLFVTLGLKNIPVELGLKGLLDCQATFSPFLTRCKGEVNGHELLVTNDLHNPKATRIVRLDEFSGVGWVSVDSEKVAYDSSIQLHDSVGQSDGEIKYATGFLINYQTDLLMMEHIKELAGLDFKGKVSLKGKTEGDSSAATIDMNIETEDFWFENFGLGKIIAPLTYEKGTLHIKTEEGALGETQYMGAIDINLKLKTLSGQFESPKLEVANVMTSLSKKINLPVNLSGQGHARVDFSGPFSIGQMTYRLEGQLQKGAIADETYDEINFDIQSQSGQVTLLGSGNNLRKNRSLIEVSGNAEPTGMLQLDFVGKGFQLEESTWVSRIFPSLTGNMQFDMSLTNHILRPDVTFKSQVHHAILGDIELPDSKTFFKLNKEGFSASLDLLGHQIISEIDIPFQKNQNARFYTEVFKLDFTELLALTTENPIRSEYKSLLTLKLDLKSETSSFLDSSGYIKVEELMLSRNNDSVAPKKPLWISIEKGQVQFGDYFLMGPETNIMLRGKTFSLRQMDALVTGTMNLKLLQLFMPFFEDFGGLAKGDLRLTGSLLKPEIYGEASIREAFLRFKGFPHPFEKISTRLDFNQNKITLNSIRGGLASGSFLGEGSIEWKGVKDLPINIRAQIKDVNLTLPEKVNTQGSGEIVFSGHWLPYTITGVYHVKQGLIEKDFVEANTNNTTIKQSIYLPKNIQATQLNPIRLDLQVIMDQNIEIKNPQMTGNMVGQFQVKGEPTNPILLGVVKMQQGSQLNFREQKFEVLTGLIKFNDPNELNPDLFISARSRIDPYDVNLMVQGKSNKPQFLLSSQPPLEDQDLISLLALGVTTQKLDKDIQSNQQAAQTGYQLGSAIISANPLNKEIKESLGVDVKFSSSFDDTKNVAVPKVTVAKELVPKKLNVSASSSMSDVQIYDVRLQYMLNDNLSAVGTYQDSNSVSNTTSNTTNSSTKTNIFGLDLEYKVEFK